MIGELFEFELKNTLTNVEMPEETSESSEMVMKLRCEIHSEEKPINTLSEGVDATMVGQIEKNSQALGRNAIWNKKSLVNSAPRYLCINFIRFYWKGAAALSGNEAGKAKILRKVMFPRVFDLYEFCTDELKAKLLEGRELEGKIREEQDNKALGGEEEKKEEEKKEDGDVEMKDESKDGDKSNTDGAAAGAAAAGMNSKQKNEAEKLVGAKAKASWVMEEIKKHDAALYKPHGSGLARNNLTKEGRLREI